MCALLYTVRSLQMASPEANDMKMMIGAKCCRTRQLETSDNPKERVDGTSCSSLVTI